MSKVFCREKILNQKLLEGIHILADNVASTMGPRGRTVIIHERDQKPFASKDGVTVSKAVKITDDPVANVAVQIMKQAAEETANTAGDGPQPLWSNILTPNGFVEMRNIHAGMKICGTNGTVQEVIGVYEKGEKEIYEVSLSEGRVVECCAEHLWTVMTNYGSQKTLTTSELSKDYKSTQQDGSSKYKYYTPKTEVEYDNNIDLPLNPYLVGVLLGDGSLGDSGTIELSLGLAKEHILSKLDLPTGIIAKTSFIPEKNYFRVKLVGKTNDGSTIHDFVEKIGLRNTNSDSKFIPQAYLLSSKNNRLALLQGLIDTDGYINNRGYFEFSTVSDDLAKDFVFLARSLGIPLHIRKHERKENDGSYSNRSIFKITELKGDRFGNKIIDIKPTGRFTQMKCIKVSNPDNLYITDNFVVTHNTTTSTVLARSILVESQKYLAAGVSPIEIKRGIDKVVVALSSKIKELAKPVTKLEDVENVATISANGDVTIGKLIAEAVDLTGKDGAVTIKEGKSLQTTLEIVEGFRFKGGIAAGQFITNERLGVMKYERPLFLITDERVDDIQQLMPTLELAARTKQPLIIIADDIFGEALAALIVNAMRGSMKVAAIKAPSYGRDRFNILQDLSIAVGATFISAQTGKTLIDVKLADLGTAKTVESNKLWTTVVGGNGDAVAISNRIESLRQEFSITEDMGECEKIQERITRLSSGVATILVGGSTEVEMIETKHRIEDALEAVRSAQEEGIVSGGGIALITAFSKLKKSEIKFDNEQQTVALNIMSQVVEAPLRQMLKNADEPADVVLEKVKKKATGYNIATRKYCDLVQAGVIDPAKVTRVALQNAASVSTTLITTNFAIIDT